jgi:hypothetical protein
MSHRTHRLSWCLFKTPIDNKNRHPDFGLLSGSAVSSDGPESVALRRGPSLVGVSRSNGSENEACYVYLIQIQTKSTLFSSSERNIFFELSKLRLAVLLTSRMKTSSLKETICFSMMENHVLIIMIATICAYKFNRRAKDGWKWGQNEKKKNREGGKRASRLF